MLLSPFADALVRLSIGLVAGLALTACLAVALAQDAQPYLSAQPQSLVVVVCDDLGRPLERATVFVVMIGSPDGTPSTKRLGTDAAGKATIELPASLHRLTCWVHKAPFVSMVAHWSDQELKSGIRVPATYRFRLLRGIRVGGRVLDFEGKPISQVQVAGRLGSMPPPELNDPRTRFSGTYQCVTDAAGAWQFDQVPNHPEANVELKLTHPDYVSDINFGARHKVDGVTMATLRAGQAILTLRRGAVLQGRVTGPDGKPIKNARVLHGEWSSSGNHVVRTDEEGRYRLPALEPGWKRITVYSPGLAPQSAMLALRLNMPPRPFQLEQGRIVRLRVVDASGKPIAGAYVLVNRWRESEVLSYQNVDLETPVTTQLDGTWEWQWAPKDSLVLHVGHTEYAPVEVALAANELAKTVTLKPKHVVTGRVVDAVSGQPIPSFKVRQVVVFSPDRLSANDDAWTGEQGKFECLLTRPEYPLRLRVEAEGYRVQDGAEFRLGDDAARQQTFRLQPSAPVDGVVLDGSGKPVPGSKVTLKTVSMTRESVTDPAGRFSFIDSGEDFVLFASADQGWALERFPRGTQAAGTLRLLPWATVRGQFRHEGQPVRGVRLFLSPIRILRPGTPEMELSQQVLTGPDGRFEFSKVVPGPVRVSSHFGDWLRTETGAVPSVPLDLQPGDQAELELGSGGGAVLLGNVQLLTKVPYNLDGMSATATLVRRSPAIAIPPELARLGVGAGAAWQDAWENKREGQAYRMVRRSWYARIAPDGAVRIPYVPAGEYDLIVTVTAADDSGSLRYHTGKSIPIVVTRDDVAKGEVRLPPLTIPEQPPPP